MFLWALFLLSILHVLAMKQQNAASEAQVPLITVIRDSSGAMESRQGPRLCCVPLELGTFSAIPLACAARTVSGSEIMCHSREDK